MELDNISFFKDNEYTGKFTKGYSLPGLWVQGKAVYYPLRNIKLEAGVHMLIYHGANKYPSMAYQDIAYWKGDQYQKGVHVLPLFRAQMALSDHVNIVLGNIYGASNHNLIEPLYNPELNLTCDPEAGLQLLYDSKAFDLDVWVNWQSFIFREDVHQEAFTVGISSRVSTTTRLPVSISIRRCKDWCSIGEARSTRSSTIPCKLDEWRDRCRRCMEYRTSYFQKLERGTGCYRLLSASGRDMAF